eukprot:195278_1
MLGVNVGALTLGMVGSAEFSVFVEVSVLDGFCTRSGDFVFSPSASADNIHEQLLCGVRRIQAQLRADSARLQRGERVAGGRPWASRGARLVAQVFTISNGYDHALPSHSGTPSLTRDSARN